jgi:glycosyltransferase involved in cell wall biosynthesis
VIATRCGGPEDIVSPEVGVLVDPGDVAQLAGALAGAHAGGRPPRPLIRAHALARYGATTVTAALREVYAEVFAKGSSPSGAPR